MRASKAVVKMLGEYGVTHVFGLPGETALPLYLDMREASFRHVMSRDERNAVIMADGYARTTWRPGVVELPGVGASMALPGLVEARISGVPIIAIVSDTPQGSERSNTLTEYPKRSMFMDAAKEVLEASSPGSLPRLLRRAFRVATTGFPGPVILIVPSNLWEGEAPDDEAYAQPRFSVFPSIRFRPSDDELLEAIQMIAGSSRPVMVCGQGVLFSQAWSEVQELSELMGMPVGTTISGKGVVPDDHPYAMGVVGSRGGTSFSNSIVQEADLVLLVGTNADSVDTWDWRVPPLHGPLIIHIDISEANLGNMYRTDLFLMGDAKLTLRRMIELARERGVSRRGKPIIQERLNYLSKAYSLIGEEGEEGVNPLQLIKALEDALSDDWVIAADPGVGAIYTSTYMRVRRPGRRFLYNYSIGALGFALPAGIGARLGGSRVLVLTSDGSFGFNAGELETIRRLNIDLKIILFNNSSFGWINAASAAKYGKPLTEEFADVRYADVARSYGLEAMVAERNSDLSQVRSFISMSGPALMEVKTAPENEVFPPVPDWREPATRLGKRYMGN